MNLVKRPAAVTSSEQSGPKAYCRAASRHKRPGAAAASLAPPSPPRYLLVTDHRGRACRTATRIRGPRITSVGKPSHAEVFVGNRRFPALLRRRPGANRGETGSVEIKEAWARATPGGAQNGAAYLTLGSPTGDRLTGVYQLRPPREPQLHQMTNDGGVSENARTHRDRAAARTARVTLEPGRGCMS